jgi:hypothetical protein
VLWPAVQILNFRVVPLQLQLVGASRFETDVLGLIFAAIRFYDRNLLDYLSVVEERGGRSYIPRLNCMYGDHLHVVDLAKKKGACFGCVT